MDPIKAKFYQSNFEMVHAHQSLSLKGLISEQGITKIFVPNGLPAYWRDLHGQTVTINLDRISVKGVLLQQFVEHGTFYEIRFREVEEPHRQYIRQMIAAEGISPGWQRKFPRIPVNNLLDPELPVPNLCLVRFVGQEIFVNVMNFTLGGIRIETLGDDLGELRVGALLNFDLITTTGEVMANLVGEVRNIAVHESDTSEGKRVTRSIGIRFKEMTPTNEKKYRQLIKDYCLILQKRLGEK